MKNITTVFKTVSGVIIALPGLAYFRSFKHPVNISNNLLTSICLAIGLITGLTLFLLSDRLKQLQARTVLIIISFTLALAITSGVGWAYILNEQTSSTINDEKVLLPFKCSGDLCDKIETAKENHESVCMRYGKDDILASIESDCRESFFYTATLYSVLFILMYDLIVVLFFTLGLKLDHG